MKKLGKTMNDVFIDRKQNHFRINNSSKVDDMNYEKTNKLKKSESDKFILAEKNN